MGASMCIPKNEIILTLENDNIEEIIVKGCFLYAPMKLKVNQTKKSTQIHPSCSVHT